MELGCPSILEYEAFQKPTGKYLNKRSIIWALNAALKGEHKPVNNFDGSITIISFCQSSWYLHCTNLFDILDGNIWRS